MRNEAKVEVVPSFVSCVWLFMFLFSLIWGLRDIRDAIRDIKPCQCQPAPVEAKPAPQPAEVRPAEWRKEKLPAKLAADRLWNAIVQVESGGKADAVGDGGKAVGVGQIHPVTIRDANRILGRSEFTLSDRLDPERSKQIFMTIANHYGRGKSDEWVARMWNGGPSWEQRERAVRNTARYWKRVSSILYAPPSSISHK